ncbi:hypothetical protein [Janthinobacterium psychrotolerans]|uniref:Uncharacterized protein n=1 Tax=Janthinobacterium psychrotolerans TaxID=1747903 RepID=A0A1A7C000_9BURK|nr:hypothetical protein [Janthinobacterium psychrotolerans]OBV38050.1 hypothetical protein ASR47_10053 [Janthinobacterium psychrotolerans]
MPDIAQLGLSIDTRQVVDGNKALDSLGEAAVRVEQKTAGATAAVDRLGEANAAAKAKVVESAAAVDAVGEAGVRAAQKVAGTTTSVDSLSAAAVRVRSTSVEGASALDGFTTASAGVWRRGGDAAKSVDSLGDATARTGQRAAVTNGQMDDTAKIMRAQAEQARATAQANTALGASTTQLTLGQQQLIERMREQAATIGMSRTQLLAYQAAQMGVTQETQRAIATIKAHEDAIKAAAKAKEDASHSSGILAGSLKILAAAYAALKVGEYIKDAALMAARYETLGVVVEVVGRNAGYTKTQMDTATDAIARQGITMIESRESATKLVQAHVDLKNATALARIAQDAAVIGHLNSSDAFDRLVNGISRGNVLILRNIGINVNLQSAYRQMADSLGKSTKELTENERVQARLNAVIERGADIAGTYEAAMGTAGKQLTSMQRYTQDLKTSIGETFNEVLTVSVMALTKHLKDANGEVSELSRNGQLASWGHSLAQVFVSLSDTINDAYIKMKLLHAGAGYVSNLTSITAQYGRDVAAAGFSADGQIAAYAKQRAAVEANKAALSKDRDDILAGEDKFQKAFDERTAAVVAKRKKDSDEKLKVDTDYMQKSAALLKKYASAPVEVQQQKQTQLAYEIYVGKPNYRDTEGREPKPKADQVENTQLADQIKQYSKEAATTKAHYDALGKLDDMYLKGGELSVQQAYQNKRDYALKTYEAEIDAFDQQIGALQGHNSATKAEAAKHQKELNEILGKRDAAEKAFFDASFTRDEEERLRQAATATAAADAGNKEIASINAQVAAVEEQIRTYGMLPAAKTALAIADLEEQSAALAGFANSEKTIELNNLKIDGLKRLRAAQGIAQAQEAVTDVAKAKELLDILTAIDTAAQAAATGMAESFGAVGKAIGGLTTALTGYERTQAGVAAQLAASMKDAGGDPTKVAKAQAAAAQQGAQAQVKSYGDMASAAKGFFKENSAGYKAMEGVEKAYRAYEMAMAVQSMLAKSGLLTAFTGLFVTSKAAEMTATVATVPVTVAAEGVKQGALATTAMAGAIAVPFPGNLAAVGIVAAMLAAIGLASGGGGGSSISLSQQRQAATGTGSVLGDSSAKSESIAHSLAIMEKNSGLGLAYSSSMVISLKQIVSGIGDLGSLLVRSDSLTTSLATRSDSGGGWLGNVSSSIFGGKTTVQDAGIVTGKTSLGALDTSGLNVSSYVDTKKSGGWFSSDKYKTALTGLGSETSDQFTKIILSLRTTIVGAADMLGLGGDAFTSQLNTFVVDLGKISLKDLKGDELQAALETAFSKAGDDMARYGVAGLEQYQVVGEGYLETLARVANDYMQVADVLAVLGKSFNVSGLGAVALSESLITATGGLDKLTSGTSFFVQNFLTEAEQMAPITKSVRDAMTALGYSGVTTSEQFKALVLAQDLSTTAGQNLYAQLIALADPFKQTADYAAELAGNLVDAKTASEIASERKDLQQQLNDLTKTETELLAIQRAGIADVNKALFDQVQAAKAVVTAKDALSKAYDTEKSAMTSSLTALKSWAATVGGLNASLALGNQSTLTPEQKYAEARAQFEKTLSAANAGDSTAQSGLSAAEQAFLTASQVVNASDARYVADYARVMAANDEAMRWASTQVDVQQASLDALTKQVSGLITINDSVLTVAQAITNLQVAMGVSNGLGVKFDGSHAGGLANVPFDGYSAELHRGEVVVDAQAAAAMRRYFGGAPSQGGGNTDALVAEVKMLREEIKGLRGDQGKQTDGLIRATVESNIKAAKTVVAGVEKTAKTSPWRQTVEYEK